MSTLFNNNNAESGYRLQYIEVYNWGTFNSKVYKLQLNGNTSLLTGANGSGKTTLVDALLTLLVPSNKRFYNQSSGAEAKKERDENSYFWGYFGKTFSDLEETVKTEQLRHKADNPYSVLLACFQNAATLHTISLVQVRWYNNGGLQKKFIVSPHSLHIDEHFGKGKFDVVGKWKKQLLADFKKTEIFDSFKEYSAKFSEIFGIKEKALSLFNQTVGIKVLGDLTQFIRQQMLEEPDAEEEFRNLHTHYTDLLISHKAIQKDEKQLELLQPIVTNKLLLDEQKKIIGELKFVQEQFPFYADKIEQRLLDTFLENLEREIKSKKLEQKKLESSIKQSEEEQKSLISQLALLNIDNQIKNLEKDSSFEEREKTRKQEQCKDYLKLATALGLQTNLSEIVFKENENEIIELQKNFEQQHEILSTQKIEFKIKKEKVAIDIEEKQTEITSLQSRKNRIPIDLIIARQRIADILDIAETELPFVGELIRVKEGCNFWEDAVEKALHSFSLRLIVPEKYNKQVNQFVHTNNLQTKLVYEKLEQKSISNLRFNDDDNLLLNKLDFKNDSNYCKWIEQEITARYNYYCTDDMNVFYGSSKAITSTGLIRNGNRHEKDDRAKIASRRYTLGWENKETIKLLITEKQLLEKESSVLFNNLKAIVPQLTTLEEKRTQLSHIVFVKSYNEINWQQHAQKIEEIKAQIKELESSNNKYQSIKNQLAKVEEELSDRRNKEKTLYTTINNLEKDDAKYNIRKIEINYENLTEKGIEAIDEFIAKQTNASLTINTINEINNFRKEFDKQINHSQVHNNNQYNDLKLETNTKISKFINPSQNVLSEFPDWSGDVINLSASIDNIDELEDLYSKIKTQRLVEHKARFRTYMDKSMLDALTNYRRWLFTEEEKIKEVIEELNIPLKKITFNKNPDTYLQLEYKNAKEQEIKQFKEQLNATIPNALDFATNKDEVYRDEVFQRIKKLITELQQGEAWRKKVTDIRNWLTFSATEFTVIDDRAGQFHENTASYSGGQKAQFTYAILGAAIAHKFGIFQTGKQHKSLRFITVDEAFSKLDPEKSQFLMEFCEQLNLQLLVVTPLDKINIAEPYINAVHFVEIKNKKNSIVYNLTMEEYNEKKELFKQESENIE